jgi:DMSO/TMAO reductase YedYZ molybdopterin-dependent catalytic subunit
MSHRLRPAIAGLLAAVTALALSELVAGLVSSVPSLVESVGGVAIDNVPPGVKDWAITTFGTADKPVLIAGIVITVAALGAVVGIVARRRFWVAIVVFGGFGVLGTMAAIIDGAGTTGAVVGGLVAVMSGLGVLRWLYGRIDADAEEGEEVPDVSRRAFVAGAGAVMALAALSAGAGRILVERAKRMVAGRDSVVLPVPAEVATAPPAAASFAVTELSPLITPNDEFYKIDTSLSTPQVDLSDWTLRVHGMVDRPYEIDFADLLDMEMVERYITLSCVSNEVGGRLVGNAKWLGVPLGQILDRARVATGAEQVVGRSVDGFTVGFPVSAVYDGRDALVAVGMNDEALPFDHGFPARLVVAGLYGYVSATKWLSDIELTTWDGFDAYWVPRGWSKEGPIKTQSRIDTPRNQSLVASQERAIAGVAWAPNLGIDRVEVQIDEEPWVEAELAEALDEDTWRQWRLPWQPSPGEHRIRVRATDASGYTQTEEIARPAPDGATGWHTIRVTVDG